MPEPKNKELWNKVVGMAKKKFKWPSRYGSYYASKLYKQKDGEWKGKKSK